MLLRRIALLVSALAVSSLAVPTTVSGGQTIDRPFHATYEGVYQDEVTHACSAGEQANLLLGDGVGSLIGRFDLRIEACVAATSPLTGDVYGTAHYATANGDELEFGFAGGYTVNLETMTIESVLPPTYVSGTGRFSNVELGVVDGAAMDFNPIGSGVSFGHVTGSIAYDASDRSAT